MWWARHWGKGEMLAFDLETTGVDRFCDVPVSFALVTVRRGRILRSNAAIVDPGRPVPAGAAAVHGISTERARSEGIDLDEAVRLIAATLVSASQRRVPVVGMKLDFDLTIVEAQLRRVTGQGLAEAGFVGPVIDALVLDRHVDRYRKGKRTLADLCAHYDVSLANAHDATSDALAAAAVVVAMAGRFRELRRTTPDDLYGLQAGWHAEWARSFNRWRRRNGLAPIDDVDDSWPIAEPPLGAQATRAG